MRIYVACHSREIADATATALLERGHEVTSRWHSKPFHPTSHHTSEECASIAQEDYDDIAVADALVLVAGPDKYSGGKFVEAGIAIGMGKPVTVIGRRENMLLWLPSIQVIESVSEFANVRAADIYAVWCRRCRSVCEYGCNCEGGNPLWPLVTLAELSK